MLISLIERFQEDNESEITRYAMWAAAMRHFKNDCEEGSIPEIRDLANYLAPIPEEHQFGALCDLVAAHMRCSWAAGEGRKLEAYLDELLELGLLENLPNDLIEDEFLARYHFDYGDFPEIQEFEERFSRNPEAFQLLRKRCLNHCQYVKLQRIGAGATSIVWEGFNHQTKEGVAIKEPLASLDEREQILVSFIHEVEITSKLQHPGIVNMTEVISNTGELPFYVMHLAGRENLSERIQAHHQEIREQKKSFRKRRDWKPILHLVAGVCDAIEHAHAKGVLHCDLKPGNVICDENDKIGVIDWGMARRIVAEEESNNMGPIGTPDYMPPEQADGIAEIRSDIFGLGTILYEALTGSPPFLWIRDGVEARPDDWADQVRRGAFPPPRKVNRYVPKPLDEICRKAMSLHPESRYQSAADLAEALRSYLSTKPGTLWFRRG